MANVQVNSHSLLATLQRHEVDEAPNEMISVRTFDVPPPRLVCLGTPLATCALPTGVFYLLTLVGREGGAGRGESESEHCVGGAPLAGRACCRTIMRAHKCYTTVGGARARGTERGAQIGAGIPRAQP